MPRENSISPYEAAQNLIEEYGAGAILKASFKAHDAICAKDISSCLFWNEVLKVLDQNIDNGHNLH